jgi:hypothetical protein
MSGTRRVVDEPPADGDEKDTASPADGTETEEEDQGNIDQMMWTIFAL